MKHLDLFNVVITHNKSCSFINDEGQKESYNRATFSLDGNRYSVKTGDDDARGQAAAVQFLKKGESFGDTEIHQDCFTLAGLGSTKEQLSEAKAIFDAMEELE